MNYFEKIRKLINVQELSQRRIDQLEKESKLDKTLVKAHKECPDLILRYLLKTRELNRKYAIDTYSTSVWDYPEKAENTLDMVDNLYTQYFSECPQKICLHLPELLEKLETS